MGVIKSIDLVGVSGTSWEDAALQALGEASKTLRNITEMQVLEHAAVIEDQKVKEFHTSVRIAFRIDR
jgi:dodecin